MPQNFNDTIEVNCLACLMKDGSLFPIVEDILEKKSFGFPSYGIIFQSIKDVVYNDLYPDLVTIEADLDRKGLLGSVTVLSNGLRGKSALEYLASLETNVENLESYAFQIQEFQAIRQLTELNEKIRKSIDSGKRPFEILSMVDLETGKIAAFVGAQSKNIKTAKDVAGESVDTFKDAANGKSKYILTGLNAWDDFTNGLYPERLYIISARSNEGKSALAQNFLYNISVVNKIPCHFFTLEMSAQEVNNRLVQIMTGISPLALERGELRESEIEPYQNAIKAIRDSPHTYDDSPELNLALLRTKIRKAVSAGSKVIFIDQLEMLNIGGSGDNQAEYLKLNFITYKLKSYAREMAIPIVLIHQLNRSSEKSENRNKEVDLVLSDLSQSGERAADVVLMLRTKGTPKFYFTKNRQSRKGSRPVGWDGSHIRFSDLPDNISEPEFISEEK